MLLRSRDEVMEKVERPEDERAIVSLSPLTGRFQMLPKSFTNIPICWFREIQV